MRSQGLMATSMALDLTCFGDGLQQADAKEQGTESVRRDVCRESTSGLRERECAMHFGGGLNHLYEAGSVFPLANHFAPSWLESLFGLTQGPPLCACASFSQDGF